MHALLRLLDSYRTLKDAVDVSSLPYSGPPQQEEDRRIWAERTLGGPWSYAAEIHDSVRRVIFLLGYLNKPDLHALGDPGHGKTHLACWIDKRRPTGDLPVRQELCRGGEP